MIRPMWVTDTPSSVFLTRLPWRQMAGSALSFFLMSVTIGCSPVGTAVGVAATTINLATQERGFVNGIDDNLIWVGINERLLRQDQNLFQKVSLQVHEGRVLLTGLVQKPEDRVLSTQIAWQSNGVREVINEIKIGRSLDFGDYSEDAWLAQLLRLKLMADRQIRANNFSIDCIRSTIYLMGIAQDATERQRVINHARDIAYVRNVKNYVRLVSEPLAPMPTQKPVLSADTDSVQKKPVTVPLSVSISTNHAGKQPVLPGTAQSSAVNSAFTLKTPKNTDLKTSPLPRSTQPATQKSVPVRLP